MMREKTIEKNIRAIIAKELTVETDSITRDTNLVTDLNADSMSVVNVVTAIESKFKISFPDDTQIQYSGYTLQFLIDATTSALKEKPAPPRRRLRTAKTTEAKLTE